MIYMGSKNKLSKELAPIIQSYITRSTKGYLEPFVGGANMIYKIEHENKIGTDVHPYLITCLKALEKGWIPPKEVSEELYYDIKRNKNKYPAYLVGYVGFQLSFGGEWFRCYRRDKIGKRNYSLEAYNNIIKQIPNLKGIKFGCVDFRELPIHKIKGYVVYCDIPYYETGRYKTGKFPYKEFYKWCGEMSKKNTVLVSEYNMPNNFMQIWSKKIKTTISEHDACCKTEKIFICRG